MTSDAHLAFQSIFNFMQILEMQEKVQKNVFDFNINAFELVGSGTHSY